MTSTFSSFAQLGEAKLILDLVLSPKIFLSLKETITEIIIVKE